MNKLQQLTQQLLKESQLKDLIPWQSIHKYLPFAIRKEAGNTRLHIVNDSVYSIETQRGLIDPDNTLCRKRDATFKPWGLTAYPPCTGCLEIARGLAMKHAGE